MKKGIFIYHCPNCNTVFEFATRWEHDEKVEFQNGNIVRYFIYKHFPTYGLKKSLCPQCLRKLMKEFYSIGELSPSELHEINLNTNDCLFVGKCKVHSDGIISFELYFKGHGNINNYFRAIVPGIVMDYGKFKDREKALRAARNIRAGKEAENVLETN